MSVQSSFDIFRRIALQEIINTTNININSRHIFNKIQNYIQYGNISISSLSDLYEPSYSKVSLSDLTAKYMLIYLEMYTQYIINAGNSETILTLNDVSKSKYQYIINKYIELHSLIKEKEYAKEYKYLKHINFSITNSVSSTLFSSVSDYELPQLSYSDMLSLPILSSEIIYPEYTTAYIDDKVLSEIIYENDNKNINAKINRTTNLFIGNIKEVTYVSTLIVNKSNIQFSGTINGYMSEFIYFKITDYNILNNNITSFIYQTSIDGKTWDFTGFIDVVDVNKSYDIFILEDINTGLKFRLDTPDILENQVWCLKLSYLKLSDAICYIKSIFNITKPISYISFNDSTEFKLTIDENIINNRSELDNDKTIVKTKSNSIKYTLPINSSLYSAIIKATQKRFSFGVSDTGNALMRYSFNINDITGYSNKYYKSGMFVIDKFDVENISTIFVDADYTLANIYEGYDISKTIILYLAVIENKYGTCEIPLIHSRYKYDYPERILNNSFCLVAEPIMINSKTLIDTSSMSFSYKLKYIYSNSLLTDSALFIFNPHMKINMSAIGASNYALFNSSNPTMHELTIFTKNHINSYYIFKHAVNLYKVEDITSELEDLNGTQNIWNKTSNRSAYMYFIDNDGKIKTAIKSIDSDNSLIPFTGSIYGKIIMYSADEDYVSPYLNDVTFGAI
jgi:hypothetical protein